MTSQHAPLKTDDLAGLPRKYVTVVLGPQRCRKTRNKDLLQQHFGCKRVVDEGSVYEAGRCNHSRLLAMREKFEDGDLFTTTRDPSQAFMNANILFELHNFATLIITVPGIQVDGCAFAGAPSPSLTKSDGRRHRPEPSAG